MADNDFRVECPVCGTSYLNSRMKIKVGPKERAIAWCVTCTTQLDIRADVVESIEQPARSWRSFWRKPAPIVTSAIVATVKVRE